MPTSLYIDDHIKDLASAKAKSDNLSFSAVVRILVTDYVNGKIEIGSRPSSYMVREVPVDSYTQQKMDDIGKKFAKVKKGA